ncbi:uncharacterized protein LOC125777581 [Bactrocera dorsalis]|uniref:Uncharacterized protein LOC125777581 n=1 Tax=Bactrocera dorsalis TaxID=27457 RepID=A0ABM3JHD1_BACDO|nr:uncharacterized protein LOC125777581 [Bactrocera dorsalis]
MIARRTKVDHRTWDHQLAEIAFAINTSQHDSTKTSAAEINFGYTPATPKQIRKEGNVPDEEATTVPTLTELCQEISHNLSTVAKRQKKYYDLRRRPWKPLIGEKVLKRDHPLSSAVNSFAQKLAPKYSGPYIVRKFKSTNTVELVNPNAPGGRTIHVHLQDLKQLPTEY